MAVRTLADFVKSIILIVHIKNSSDEISFVSFLLLKLPTDTEKALLFKIIFNSKGSFPHDAKAQLLHLLGEKMPVL